MDTEKWKEKVASLENNGFDIELQVHTQHSPFVSFVPSTLHIFSMLTHSLPLSHVYRRRRCLHLASAECAPTAVIAIHNHAPVTATEPLLVCGFRRTVSHLR